MLMMLATSILLLKPAINLYVASVVLFVAGKMKKLFKTSSKKSRLLRINDIYIYHNG